MTNKKGGKSPLFLFTFGMLQAGRNWRVTEYRFGFNGMEKDDEVKGSGNSYTSMWRQYDPRIGRWQSIDPKFKKFAGWSPYNNNENNPIFNADPNGDCPWCVGAAIGVILDIGLQTAEIALSDDKSIEDFSFASVLVSGTAGAVGVGLAAKVGKLAKVTRVAVEVATDASASAVHQQATEGDVDWDKVAIDAVMGQGVGKVVGKAAKAGAKSTDKAKVLDNAVDRAQRVANQSKRSPARAAAKQTNADNAQGQYDNYVETRGAAAATAASQAGSKVAEEFKDQTNDKKKP